MVKKFHSQYYVNGSECDLTGKARETQIKVFWYLFTLFTLFIIIIIDCSVGKFALLEITVYMCLQQ